MYFKHSMRYNPEAGTSQGYYRLVESYRNIEDRVCHKTLLNIGFIGHLQAERLNIIQKQLTLRAEGKISMFEEQDPLIRDHVENLELIKAKGYDYVCVARSSLKDYQHVQGTGLVKVSTKSHQIFLEQVSTKDANRYYLKVTSPGKRLKESSMNKQFQERFEEKMEVIKARLSKKGGIKRADKIYQSIGRVREKYPSVAIVTSLRKPPESTDNGRTETAGGLYMLYAAVQSLLPI